MILKRSAEIDKLTHIYPYPISFPEHGMKYMNITPAITAKEGDIHLNNSKQIVTDTRCPVFVIYNILPLGISLYLADCVWNGCVLTFY